MISTIVSRCQRFDFKKLTTLEIIKRLKVIAEKEKVKIEDSALELIAVNSGGSFRDAEGLLDQVLTFSDVLNKKEIKAGDIKDLLGLVEINLISEFCDLLLEKSTKKAIQFILEIENRGVDIQEFTKALISYLRKTLILSARISSLPNAKPSIIELDVTVFIVAVIKFLVNSNSSLS